MLLCASRGVEWKSICYLKTRELQKHRDTQMTSPLKKRGKQEKWRAGVGGAGRKTLSDMTERGTTRVGGERLSNHFSSVPPQEAVCFCGCHALKLNTFQQVFYRLGLKV